MERRMEQGVGKQLTGVLGGCVGGHIGSLRILIACSFRLAQVPEPVEGASILHQGKVTRSMEDFTDFSVAKRPGGFLVVGEMIKAKRQTKRPEDINAAL